MKWFMDQERLARETSQELERIHKESIAQKFSLNAGLGMVPKRTLEVELKSSELATPVTGTNITYVNDLQNTPANTWRTVQNFIIPAPRGKSSASLALICTPVMRANFVTGNLKLARLTVNGVIGKTSASGESGLCVGGGNFSNAQSLNVSAQVFISNPSSIINDASANRPNCMRTFYMAVWT